MTDGDRRTAAQQHLNSRAERISAYAASLEAALAVTPTGDRATLLQRRLDQARQDLASASRMRLPDETKPRPRGARIRPADSAPATPTATATTTVAIAIAIAPDSSIAGPR